MACEEIRVINGRNNPSTLVFGRHVPPAEPVILNLNDPGDEVTRMTLELEQDGVLIQTIDTNIKPTSMTWAGTDGEVVFDLGPCSIVAGDYCAQLFIYSPSRPLGQLLVPEDDDYSFSVEAVDV